MTSSAALWGTGAEAFFEIFLEHAEKDLVHAPTGRFTYRDGWDLAGKLATVALDAGYAPGDGVVDVGFVEADRPVHYALQVAASMLGARATAFAPGLPTDALVQRLRYLRARVVFASSGVDVAAVRAGYREGRVIAVEDGTASTASGVVALADVPSAVLEPRVDPSSPAAIVFTSGSSAASKGVVLTQEALGWIYRNAARFPPWPEAAQFLDTPLLGGIGTRGVIATGGTILFEPHLGRDIRAIVGRLRSPDVTASGAVPTGMSIVASGTPHDELDGTDLDIFMYAGSRSNPAHLEAFQRIVGRCLVQCYGQTECPQFITMLGPGEHVGARRRSAGRPVADVELALRDEDRGAVDAGTVGEIVVRSPWMMTGYWDEPAMTARAFTADGWLRTGDLGRLDADGYLFIEGRIAEQAVVGGYNVLLTEVEDLLRELLDVRDVAVVATPHPMLGESLTAFIAVPAGDISLMTVRQRFREREVHGSRVPSKIVTMSELPRSQNGKVDKQSLAKTLVRAD
ncbi:MAG: class I adenylate-forming enzyme family protein [Actinomycetota bacterium]